jgi:hypothetical protein
MRRKEVIYTFSVGGDAEDVIGIEYLKGGWVAPQGSFKICIKAKGGKE